ncbi:3-isopropylmalate dehydratase [Robertmurraya kyonggiensis]|uniref:3-isopropylmalate dehydratase small subunit n=1 Tax=Robertmurraya kyonggiensis TaxID=1037680 RepID=A0A4U1D5U8_9BACI|nr:3-isopropylmalate dehydratase [Robertmurraya kyonggiensis]TKC18015.1 3-isopropylmalate dehydratase [Robertmurraya kyonggiensis]
MIQRGRVHVLGEDINTDYIISAKHKESKLNISDMVPYLMEDIEPDFSKKIEPGDFIIAGKNFGCGSSREAAPAVIKAAGIAGVLSPLFARIFFRNAINVGLPVLEFENATIEGGEFLEVNFKEGIIVREMTGETFKVQPLPDFMLSILNEGGLIPYLKKHKQFNLIQN